jgi:DNA-binding NtrC family response regulator
MLGIASTEPGMGSQAVINNAVAFSHGMTLAEIEKQVILETLKRQNFNRTRAARVLGIGIRTLQRKLKQYRQEAPGMMPVFAD